jgi:hypothetical protein
LIAGQKLEALPDLVWSVHDGLQTMIVSGMNGAGTEHLTQKL